MRGLRGKNHRFTGENGGQYSAESPFFHSALIHAKLVFKSLCFNVKQIPLLCANRARKCSANSAFACSMHDFMVFMDRNGVIYHVKSGIAASADQLRNRPVATLEPPPLVTFFRGCLPRLIARYYGLGCICAFLSVSQIFQPPTRCQAQPDQRFATLP